MQIKTIVVLGSLNNAVDLSALTDLGNSYKLTRSQGYLKLRDNITASLYKTGKVQIYGIKQVSDIPQIWKEMAEIIKPYVDVSHIDKEPVLKFMVGVEKLPYQIDLPKICAAFPKENIEYEPEQFPGLIWKTGAGTALLFSSGSAVISGLNSEEKILACISYLREKVEPVLFQK